MTLTSLQKKLAWISTIITSVGIIGGSVFQVYSWVDSSIVTKDFLTEKISKVEESLAEAQKSNDISINDLRLLMIDESLSRYYTIGLDNLSDQEKHRYDKLILAEQANDKQRKTLLGL